MIDKHQDKMSEENLTTENCVVGTQDSVVSGERIATYVWNCGNAKDNPVGIALLLHGFRSHACFNVRFFLFSTSWPTSNPLFY